MFKRFTHLNKHFLECAALMFLFTVTAYGQGLGTIVGTVTDSSGAVVPSATVKVTQTGTGLERSVATNAQGYFVVPSLQPSQYELEVMAPGFQIYFQKNITLRADQTLTINASLKIGAAEETITITGEPPQVDTTTGALGQVVDEQRMVDMPLNGRNAASLTLLVAGTVTTPANGVDQGNTKTFPTGVTISTNGARQSQISYNLDGGNNADIQTNINQPFPFPDALQEFSVQTSNYSARYGMNAGGVVNVVTKSGTNHFHGDVFEFVRNSAFNARNFFAADVDQLKRNQFGGTLGGPVRRDKTFFFAGYQGTLIRNTSSKQATIPTIANLNGDFSALLDPNNPANPSPGKTTRVIDPASASGTAFPGNIIPVGRLDAAALTLEKMLPQVGGNGQIRFVQPLAQNFHEFLGRVDHFLAQHDKMTGRYFYDRFTQAARFDPTNLLTYSDSSTIVSQNALLSETHIFGSALINEANLSYSRVASGRLPPPGAPSMTSLGVNIYDGGLNAIQNIQVTNFFTVGSDPPAHFTRNSYRLNDDASWIHGGHSFHFGGSIQRDLYDVRNDTNIPGDFRFNASVTKYAPAAFLLGQINQLTQGSGQFVVNRNNFIGVYIQDDFHVSRQLSLNLGLRYEPFFPWHALEGRVMEFNPTAYQSGITSRVFTNAPKGLLFPGDPGVPERGYTGDYKNFAPRAGFAYDVFGDGKTSIRGGAGMFYDTHIGAINGQTWGSATPFSTSLVFAPNGPFSDPYQGRTNPFPAPFPAPSNYVFPTPTAAYGYDPNSPYRVAVIYNWNLAIERQLAVQWLLRAAYVGSRGSHLQEFIQLNPAVPPGTPQTTDQRRIFQPFGLIGMFEQDINSSYHALQMSLEKRLSHGFTILANYTYSKSLDDTPNGQAVTAMNVNLPNLSTIPWDQPGRHLMDHGPSIFDRTHRFVASYVWSLPAWSGTNRFVRSIIGGWQLTGIATAQTGDPLTIVAGADVSQTGLNADRAVQVGSPYGGNACGSTAPCVNYLSPTAFQLPATGTFGTTGKGSLRGSGYFNWDMGLGKNFGLPGEHLKLQFRAEYFNAFNRANFNDPAVSLQPGFGQILGAQDPRIGQLSLKLTF